MHENDFDEPSCDQCGELVTACRCFDDEPSNADPNFTVLRAYKQRTDGQ